MHNKKVIVSIVAVVIVGAGSLIWFDIKKDIADREDRMAGINKYDVCKQSAQNTIDMEKIDTSNWKTYKNNKYGFELKYDNNWIFKEFHTQDKDGGNGVCFEQINCLSEIAQDCDNYVCISVIDDLASFNLRYEAKSEDYRESGHCRNDIPLLDFSEPFLDMRACCKDNFGYVWDNYYFIHNNLGYEMTIRHADPNYDPKIERTVLESFKLIQK
jgi:hypothetical protein